jgi:hypothetical protein
VLAAPAGALTPARRDLEPFRAARHLPGQAADLGYFEQSASALHTCPRSESHLTYMINITLTTEFALGGGVR